MYIYIYIYITYKPWWNWTYLHQLSYWDINPKPLFDGYGHGPIAKQAALNDSVPEVRREAAKAWYSTWLN